MNIEQYKEDKKIFQAIQHLGCENKLSVFRFRPNVSYNWHYDKIRNASINMLIDGFDSFCAFGEIDLGRKYSNIKRLQHEPNCYYLLNVKKMHCVFNFSQKMRYIISIGIPQIRYVEALEYFRDKKLLSE